MGTAFTRTMRALRADGFAWSMGGIAVAIVLLAAWGAWLTFAKVAQYETSDSARLEVDRATYVLQADSAGRVVVSNLTLGREVRAGDVLVELDANPEQLEIAKQMARHSRLPALPTIVACNIRFAAFQWRSTMLCANVRVWPERA